MSKVMNELFLDGPVEAEIELAADSEYGEWSDNLEEQLQAEFGDNANVKVDKPPF